MKDFLKPRPNDRNTPTQHIATLLGATCCVRLATMLRHVGCCWLKFENSQIGPNNTQHVATCRNMVAKRTQHVAPNNVAMCCVGMLRSFGRGFMVIMASGIARGRVRTATTTTTTTESRNMAAILTCTSLISDIRCYDQLTPVKTSYPLTSIT